MVGCKYASVKMTVFWLRKLHKLLQVPGVILTSEFGWVQELVRHILGAQATEETLAAAVQSRTSCQAGNDQEFAQLTQLEQVLQEETLEGEDFQNSELQEELEECKRNAKAAAGPGVVWMAEARVTPMVAQEVLLAMLPIASSLRTCLQMG